MRAREAFGIELTLRHLFQAQTVANLAATIETLLVAKLEAMSDEEAQRLLGELSVRRKLMAPDSAHCRPVARSESQPLSAAGSGGPRRSLSALSEAARDTIPCIGILICTPGSSPAMRTA